MKYPHFAAEVQTMVQQLGRRKVMELLDASDRSMTEYLAGRYLPRAEKIFPFPKLSAAVQKDIPSMAVPELSAA